MVMMMILVLILMIFKQVVDGDEEIALGRHDVLEKNRLYFVNYGGIMLIEYLMLGKILWGDKG